MDWDRHHPRLAELLVSALNAERGMVASMMIGAVGVAPVFVSAASAADELSLPFAFFAAGAAVGFLALSDLVHRRFGV
jgi:hypothetical protein